MLVIFASLVKLCAESGVFFAAGVAVLAAIRAFITGLCHSNAHKAVMAHLRTLGHRVTLATIRRSVIAESYTAAALPLPVYSPRCGVAKDYEALAYEVMAWNDESEVKA